MSENVFCSICKETPLFIVFKLSLAHWHDISATTIYLYHKEIKDKVTHEFETYKVSAAYNNHSG